MPNNETKVIKTTRSQNSWKTNYTWRKLFEITQHADSPTCHQGFHNDKLHAFLLISSTRTCNTLKTICVPIRHPKCRFDSYSWMKPQLSSQSLLQPADRRDSHRELGWTPAQSQDSWCFHFVLTVRFHVCIIMRYVSKLVLTNRFPRCLATNCTPEHAPPPSLQLYRCDVQCVFV